jgi:hypothetical protein
MTMSLAQFEANHVDRFPDMFSEVGLRASAGIVAILVVVVSIIPTILLQWKGKSWRQKS